MADAVLKARECTRCRTVKPVTGEHFRVVREIRNGLPYVYQKRQCKPCEFDQRVEWGRRNRERQNAGRRTIATPAKYRSGNLKTKYGLTPEAYDEMLAAQAGCCAICGLKSGTEYHRSGRFIPLTVDHCHETGVVRGLLCGQCNRGLGDFRDNLTNLERAIAYLGKFNGR